MRRETIASNVGCEPDSRTKVITAPNYQTVASPFCRTKRGAPPFDLEAGGFRGDRISSPRMSVPEQSVAPLEGGVGSIWANSGRAAIRRARSLVLATPSW
jgi:O-acetylhomoserine/O-acetylserine sulfhydrylase-like pyridoxal-dependent enzyme